MCYNIPTRVSYNGYYVSFPRIRREFDSLHPHQQNKDNPKGVIFVLSHAEAKRGERSSSEVGAERKLGT